MDALTWEKITETHSRLEAELLKSFMEAEGVPVELIHESAGENAYPVTFGPLAKIQIFVPKEKLEEAHLLLEAFSRSETGMEIAEDTSEKDKTKDE